MYNYPLYQFLKTFSPPCSENRQFRVEQRDKDGNVVGEYGYKDGGGKMNVFKYTSSAAEGFRSEKMQ